MQVCSQKFALLRTLLTLITFSRLIPSVLAQPMGPPPPHHEGVNLSLSRFETLFEASHQKVNRARWREGLIEIDLSTTQVQGVAWVSFQARAELSELSSGVRSATLDLASSTVHPLSVWRDGIPLSPTSDGSFHQIVIPAGEDENGQRPSPLIKLRYPVRLTHNASGELSALLPLPPIANADVRVIGQGRAKFIPELSPNQAQITLAQSLRGSIAVLIPAAESGLLLQRKDFSVSLHPSGDGADIELALQALVRGGALQSWVPVSPASDALISASADGQAAITDVRDGWHMVWIEGAGEHNIKAKTRAKIDRSSGQPRLTLSPQSAPRAQLKLTLVGEREVITEPAVPFSSEIKGEGNQEDHKLTLISADLPPLNMISLRWTEKRVTPEEESPEFLTETYQLFSLQEGLLKGEAQLELDVIKGELKQLDIKVPSEVVLYHLSGGGVENWITLPQNDQSEGTGKTVRVSFGDPRSGKSALSLKWQRVLSNKEALTIPIIHPLNAFQESGVIALYDGDRVGFTPAETTPTTQGEERLIPVGQESIPQRILQLKAGEKVSQAFRHVQAPTMIKTSTTTERARELRFDAQLDTLYSLRDGAVRAQSQLLLNLKSGRLETLTLSLPSACSEPQVSGPSINRVEPLKAAEGDDASIKKYQIRFTRRLEGAVTLNIDVEQLITNESTSLSFPRVVVEGAELTQGHIGLTAEAGLEVSPTTLTELRRVTLDELPRSVTLRSATELLYGYRYSRGWSLDANLKRHKIIETLNAEVSVFTLESFLLKSGQRVDIAEYTIDNRDRRDIKLTLPPESSIQEVLVNGSPVRARAEGEQISVPLPKNQELKLSLRYEVKRDTKELYRYELIAPTSDLRTTSISWRACFSDSLQLWSWSGPMRVGSRSYHTTSSSHRFSQLMCPDAFTYDLLSPGQEALSLKLQLRGVISDETLWRLYHLGLLSLILIGVRRGRMLAGKAIPKLKYPEMIACMILVIDLGLMFYQVNPSVIERQVGGALLILAFIIAVTWSISKLTHFIREATQTQKERRDEKSIQEDQAESSGESS